MLDLTYPGIVLTGRALFRALGLRFQLSGTEHVPRSGGALLAFNHVSYVDFILGGYAAVPAGRLVRFMAKREIFAHPVAGPLMRSMHHVPVDRGDGAESLQHALRLLEAGEVVGIFPEATISRSFEVKDLKTGAVRIAAEAGVPLVPVALWGTQRILTKDHPRDLHRGKTIAIRVGEPMHPAGEDPTGETAALRSRLGELVDAAVRGYPPEEQPPGCWWLPASCGGSAPTPDEAARLDAAERDQRAARKAARAEARNSSRRA